MDSKQFIVLEASAGSGKTFSLALRYVYLLLEGGKIGEILALTFTNKAVDEMRQRIGDFLLLLGREPEGEEKRSKREDLLIALQKEYGWEREKVLELAPILLKAYWSQTPRIMTLDSFFGSVLRKFCWYAGVTNHFEIGGLDETKIEEIFLQRLSDTQGQRLITLCFKHQKSLDQVLKSIELVGEKFIDCLSDQLPYKGDLEKKKEEVLEIAKEIQSQIRTNPLSSASAIRAVDFNHFSGLLSKGKTWIKNGENYTSFKKLNLEPLLFIKLREKLSAFFSSQEKEFVGFINEISTMYQDARNAYVKVHNLLNFPDVVQKTYALLCQDEIPSDFFYFRLDDRISHILLDEFQDTNVVQYKILLPLIEEILSGIGRIGNRSFFVVGDKKQSIYQFRGGYGKLLDIVKDLPHMQSEYLDTNYRSQARIVEFINKIFSQAIPSYVPQNSKKKGGYIKICDVLEIEEKKQAFKVVKANIEEFLNHGIALSDIAVLVFKNSDVMELGDFLKKDFKPIATKESIALAHKKDAQILLSSLRYALTQAKIEKKRVAKLLGKTIDEEVEILKFENQSVGEYIYSVMQFYKLNSKVAKQVFELACLSQNVEDFLERVKRCSSVEDDQEGLKILTIHASKGLEFKHLIVLDRLSASSNLSDLFFCQYDDLLKGKIFMNNGSRDAFDEDFQAIAERQKADKEEERKNLLYVALTRACHSLVIVPILRGKGKSEFECIGLVKNKEILYPYTQGEIQKENQKIETSFQEIQIQQKSFGKQEDFIRKDDQKLGNTKAMKYGEIVHKALELFLGYGANAETLFDVLRHSYGNYLDEKELRSILQVLQKVRALLNAEFGEVEFKSEISFIQDLKLFRIDCLLLCQDKKSNSTKAVILDYKTGDRKDSDYEQVRHYVDFARREYAQVCGYLLYLRELELVRVV